MKQWRTLEEFKANPIDGWCWITFIEMNGESVVDIAYHSGTYFYLSDECGNTVYDTWSESKITHVQSIPKPEVPK